jgi:hypothetical protein
MILRTMFRILGLYSVVLLSGCSSVSLTPKNKTVAEALAEKTSVTLPVDLAPALADDAASSPDTPYVCKTYDTALVPDQDEDGDGLSNMEEFVAGSNPRDKASRPVIRHLSAANNMTHFEVTTVPDRLYTVEYKTNLNAGAWLLLTNRIGDGSVLAVDEDNKESRRFYRFIVQLPQ